MWRFFWAFFSVFLVTLPMLKYGIFLVSFICSYNSYSQKNVPMTHKHTNALINETSPYLLQHAHNPVNWEAWSDTVLERAKKENKPLLISIGYAACHWCHVMEHECFEDEEVAAVMNANFINIKIDREERPDIDHIYMDALQMMTGSGGWPLNIVALPDGRPFWGATYMKKQEWIRILTQLSNIHKNDFNKVEEYAQSLAEGIKTINLVEVNSTAEKYTIAELDKAIKNWAGYFDTFLGGNKRAPKFMMPANLDFLLHYATATENKDVLEYVNVTLTRMAHGGIFDHIGGGFSRYSVDTKWHVPHFEKMLYDNGLLVSLYAKAYAETKNELYKKTADETIAFVASELMHSNGGFYSSLDADSLTKENELEEGAYYVWQEEELKSLLSETNFEIFKDYYNINSYGHWEHGNYVLIRDVTDEQIAKKHTITVDALNTIITDCKSILNTERNKRNRPRLDDKILTSWNGLMLKGLVDAYRYLNNDEYLEVALKNASFITKELLQKDGSLFHNHKNGKSTINGYLEDYAAVIDAFLGLYEVTFDEKWLRKAKQLSDYCIINFLDAKSGMFFFTSKNDTFVIRRTIEATDNVIPASNSIMAKNLFKLDKFFPSQAYDTIALQMFKNVQANFQKNAYSHANWMHLALYQNLDFHEIAIVGDDFKVKAKEIILNYLPNAIIAGASHEGKLSLLQNRYVKGNTLIYVCLKGTCKLPVKEIAKALNLLTE